MANITLYEPHPKQLTVHQDPHRFKVLNWGRRTGKSFFAINYTLIQALAKQGRYFIVAPTYKQAKDIYWRQFVQMLPKEVIYAVNNSELIITLEHVQDPENGIYHDPKKPRSTIELKGMDDADKLRGMEAQGIVFDEFAFSDNGREKWEMVFEPMLLTTRGWVIFISTPNGFNFFYEMSNLAQTDDGWFYSHATPYDNPAITPEDIDKIKRERSEDNFYQEYMAEFRRMEGLVYREFDRKHHMVDPSKVPKDGTNIVCMDFGFHNPFAAAFIRIDYDGNWWVYDEIYKSELITDQIVSILKEKTMGTHIAAFIGDAQAAEQIASLNQKGIPVIPSVKGSDSVRTGIQLVQDKLKLRPQAEGAPKPSLFISSNCEKGIFEFETYSYQKDNDLRNAKEEPVKKDDHFMDAVRYGVLTWKNGFGEEYNFPEEDLPEYV